MLPPRQRNMALILWRKQPQKLAVVRQYFIAMLAALPFAVAGSAIAWPSPVLPKVLAGQAPVSQVSWAVSTLYLGQALGVLPAALLADKLGPKRVLWLSGVLPIISWSILLTTHAALGVYVSRLLAGLHWGIASVVHPIYVSEISQTDLRDSLVALSNITLNSGVFLTFVVGPFVPLETSTLVFMVLPVLFLFSFLFAPESPHFFLARHDIKNARNSLQWLRGDLNRIELEFELDRIEKIVENNFQMLDSIKDTFVLKALRKDLITVIVLSTLDGLSGANVIQANGTVTFPNLSCVPLSPNYCMIILGFFTLVSSFIANSVRDLLSRKGIVVAGYLVCSISMASVGANFFALHKTELTHFYFDFVPFLGCLVHLVVFSFVHSQGLRLVCNQEFNPKIYTSILVISVVTSALASFVVNKFYLIVAHQEGVYLNFCIFSVASLVAGLFTVSYVSENNAAMLEEQDESSASEPAKPEVISINGF